MNLEDRIRRLVREIPDWPQPGIVFRDITPLINEPASFAATVDAVVDEFVSDGIDRVIGVEARGFIFAAPVAYRLGAGFVPVRKPGKLPWEIENEEYALEYGTDLLEVHRDGISPGERVLIVDDVLATGGTASATTRLVERLGGEVVGLAFIVELAFLSGRAKLGDRRIRSLALYDR
ncbi:MAG: adenine phosphoribosyltransferase [Acidimicrobiales bacterium]|nr:adenine phosphoribosyltransferase [Acidimicrobiales bacterium]